MIGTSCDVGGKPLAFHCDANQHRVVVTNGCGDMQWAFGTLGSGAGSFNTPLGLTLVRPEFAGERLAADGPNAAWLAVADYGNHRVQIFELDGAWVGTIDTRDAGLVGPPCVVRWCAPFLEIEGVDGARARVHLSAALLWASTQTPAMPFMIRLRPHRVEWDQN
jgi:hypothetical protein